MTRRDFLISDSGYVYLQAIRKPGGAVPLDIARRLGHISDLLGEQTRRGELVRNWWTRYLGDIERQLSAVKRPPNRRFDFV